MTITEAIKEKILNEDEYDQYEEGELGFELLRTIIKNAGYTDADISEELIGCLNKQNKDYQKRVAELEQEKLKNTFAEEIAVRLNRPTCRGYL